MIVNEGATVRTAKIPQGTARHQGAAGLQKVATRRVGRLGSVGLDLLLALPDAPPPTGPGGRETSLALLHSTGLRSLVMRSWRSWPRPERHVIRNTPRR
jgi:hypothetical protein